MKRLVPVIIGIAAIGVLVAGCSTPAPTSTAPKSGGTLVYASGRRGAHLPRPARRRQLPAGARGDPVPRVARLARTPTARSSPGSPPSGPRRDDGLSWDFTLRDDVKFTDGTPLDADAVAANIAHLQDPSTGVIHRLPRPGQGRPRSTAVDAHTARISLSAPDSALLDSLSQPWLAIESPTALKRSQEVNCASPVGTGPFIVEEVGSRSSRSPSCATTTTTPRRRMPPTTAPPTSRRSSGASSPTPPPATRPCRPARST